MASSVTFLMRACVTMSSTSRWQLAVAAWRHVWQVQRTMYVLMLSKVTHRWAVSLLPAVPEEPEVIATMPEGPLVVGTHAERERAGMHIEP